MHKDVQARYILNPLYEDAENQYTKGKRVRGKIKKSEGKKIFEDITNSQNSIESQNHLISKVTQQIPKKIALQIFEQEDSSLHSIKSNSSQLKLEQAEKEEDFSPEIKSQSITSRLQLKKQNSLSHFQALKDVQKEQNEENSDKIEINAEVVNNSKRKKLFNFTFEDSDESSQEETEIQQQTSNGAPKQEIEVQEQLQQKKQESEKISKNIDKFLLMCSESEQENSEIGEIKEQVQKKKFEELVSKTKIHKNTGVNEKEAKEELNMNKKKFLFDEDQIESSDQQTSQNADSQFQQIIRVTKKTNIQKIKAMNPFHGSNSESLLKRYEHLLIMPISDGTIYSMMIKRNSDESQYIAYDDELVRHVIGVRKKGNSYRFYVRQKEEFISLKNSKKLDRKKLVEVEIAKMKTNFLGTQYHCYIADNKDKGTYKQQLISIRYETNILGLNGPRKITLYLPEQNILLSQNKNLMEIYEESFDQENCQIKKFVNKAPKWSSDINAYVLDFKGRATKSSVKNCIIVDAEDEKEFLIFGKVSKDIFNLDIKEKFSIVQAMALAVSSFEKKLGCE